MDSTLPANALPTSTGRIAAWSGFAIIFSAALVFAVLAVASKATATYPAARSSVFISVFSLIVSSFAYLVIALDVAPKTFIAGRFALLLARNAAWVITLPLLTVDLALVVSAPLNETIFVAALTAAHVLAQTTAAFATGFARILLFIFSTMLLAIPLLFLAGPSHFARYARDLSQTSTSRLYRELQISSVVVLLLHPLAFALSFVKPLSIDEDIITIAILDTLTLVVLRILFYVACAYCTGTPAGWYTQRVHLELTPATRATTQGRLSPRARSTSRRTSSRAASSRRRRRHRRA